MSCNAYTKMRRNPHIYNVRCLDSIDTTLVWLLLVLSAIFEHRRGSLLKQASVYTKFDTEIKFIEALTYIRTETK